MSASVSALWSIQSLTRRPMLRDVRLGRLLCFLGMVLALRLWLGAVRAALAGLAIHRLIGLGRAAFLAALAGFLA